VRRATAVRVDYVDREGQPRALEARGMAAIVFQHELDHLDGRLFLDRVASPGDLVTVESFDRFVRGPFLERVARAALPAPEVREV
jgi:peptide deformylase